MGVGLYIHVPFCESKCNYCDFYSVAPAPDSDQRNYIESLQLEMDGFPDDFSPRTVYIGGGTPSVLTPDLLAKLLNAISERIDTDKLDEYTVEVNPGTVTSERLGIMRDNGVDRISLGVQSFSDDVLSFLGRSHSSADICEAVMNITDSGIDNFSIDIIFGVPETDLETVEQDVEKALALQPAHISSYALMIAAGTRLHFLQQQGELQELDEDLVADQFELVRDKLTASGMHHYEISNFAFPGRECRHNMLYWGGGSYIGCGPSAHSHWRGVRYSNIPNLWEYNQALATGRSPWDQSEELAPRDKARETLVMWLRRLDGVDVAEFERVSGYGPFEICRKQIEELLGSGLLQYEHGILRLSPEAVFISDSVFRNLI